MGRLKKERSWSLAKIKQYEKEVGTLRTIMRGYIKQIDSLNTLNKQLIEENVSFRGQDEIDAQTRRVLDTRNGLATVVERREPDVAGRCRMEIRSRFDHFNINVSDLDRSLAFYGKALGLREVGRKQAADGSFTLVYLGDPQPPDRVGGIEDDTPRAQDPDRLGDLLLHGVGLLHGETI